MGPGAFDACLALIVDERQLSSVEDVKAMVGRVATRPDLEKIVSSSCILAPAYVERALRDALEVAGLGGRIIVEKAASDVASVELVSGYTFRLAVAIPFVGGLADPRVGLVDGFIESVAEIDGLLQEAHHTRDPLLLFARGMAPDVINTLRVNNERATLRVIPVVVPLELSSMNTLVDLAVVAGADVVSAAKGDLILALRLASCPRIERANVHQGRVMLVSSRTKQAVVQHVSELRRKRHGSEHDELGQLLDERVKSLSPGHVVLRLPDDRDFVPAAQAVDRALRGVSAAVSRGLVDRHGLPTLDDPAPVGSVVGALLHGARCRAELDRIGAVITP